MLTSLLLNPHGSRELSPESLPIFRLGPPLIVHKNTTSSSGVLCGLCGCIIDFVVFHASSSTDGGGGGVGGGGGGGGEVPLIGASPRAGVRPLLAAGRSAASVNEPAYLKQRPFIVDSESATQRGESEK